VAHKCGSDRNILGLKIQDVTIKGCGSSDRKTLNESEITVKDESVGQNSCRECENSTRTGVPHEQSMKQEVMKDLAQSGNNVVMKDSELTEKPHSKGVVRLHRHGKKSHRRGRKHSHRKEKGAIFEGERVSYLVGQCEAEETHQLAGKGEQISVKEDDYVLRKLFKKSGESFTCKIHWSCVFILILMLFLFHWMSHVKI
jgi:hypothetical protein